MGTRRLLWKIVTNPTVEVVAVIVAVLLAAWTVIQADVESRHATTPIVVPTAQK